MKFIILLIITSTIAFTHEHKNCCNHKKKWSSNLSLSATNTSSSYEPTNHHKGLALDHSSLSLKGPTNDYLDFSSNLAFNTSTNTVSGKTRLTFEIEELAIQTTKEIHESFSAQIGRFPSHITPINQESCCGYYFIKRPILYRAFLGGHLTDNGLHIDFKFNHDNAGNTQVGFESFEGKSLMTKSNKVVGLLAWMVRHQQSISNNAFDLSFAYVLNTLYNQKNVSSDHIGCCQGGLYTGKNMFLGYLAVNSELNESLDSIVSLEIARVSQLKKSFSRNDFHLAYNAGVILSVKNLPIGKIEIGIRRDQLRSMSFCPCDGPYKTKTVEKTAMIGWKISHLQSLRFEYTNQTHKQNQDHIFQIKYTVNFSIF